MEASGNGMTHRSEVSDLASMVLVGEGGGDRLQSWPTGGLLVSGGLWPHSLASLEDHHVLGEA